MHVGEGNRGHQKFPRVGRWNLGLGSPGWGSGFSGRGFDTRGCFLLRLPSSQLRGCCGFGLRLLRPGRLPGSGDFRLLGSFRVRLGRGIWNRGWWGSGLENTTPSNDVIPPLAQVNLLGTGRGPLFFRAVRWAVVALFRPRSGACFASTAFASFHFTQPR